MEILLRNCLSPLQSIDFDVVPKRPNNRLKKISEDRIFHHNLLMYLLYKIDAILIIIQEQDHKINLKERKSDQEAVRT